MQEVLLNQLKSRSKPIDIIQVGLGFMGFGFFSNIRALEGFRVPLIITRRPKDAKKFLEDKKIKAIITSDPKTILDFAGRGFVALSSDLSLIESLPSDVVIEMTGTVNYGTQIALKTIKSGKHLVTMNPELMATVGTELKALADAKRVLISDVYGDQPGSLTRLISEAKFMGFEILIAGNMKRYLDLHATQEQMAPWAKDKGLAVRQTTSFTDGTKQAIEMNLVSNFYGLKIVKPGMLGVEVEDVRDILKKVDFTQIPKGGVVDYVIGRNVFPGVFIVAKHTDPNQQNYLKYLGLGDGPYYVLFEPYHLCHLEVPMTIAKLVLEGSVTINNGDNPTTRVVAYAKSDRVKGDVLDGIGGDSVYGVIHNINGAEGYLPVGIAEGAKLIRNVPKDQPIKLSDVKLKDTAATRLLGFVETPKPRTFRGLSFFNKLSHLL